MPDTTTIIEDQFLEPMAAETGIESDKGADRLTRNDRKRMVRRISIKLAREEKEHIKKMDLAESSTIGGGKEARKSIRNEARKSENHSDNQNNSNSSNHNRRSSILHKEHYITENQDIRNQLTNCHNFVTGQEAGEEHDFLSERSSSSFIEDDTVQNKTEPAAAPFLNSNQCYDKRLEKFRRNTLISLHRGSVGAAEQSQGLIIGQESQKNSKPDSSFHDLNKELDKNSRMSVSRKIINNNPEESMKARRESMKIIEKKSSIVHERTKSISRRDGSAMPKLVDNEENVSSYPLPGTEYSTKMGGTWRPSQYARNLLTEDEITEVVNKAFDEEMQTN